MAIWYFIHQTLFLIENEHRTQMFHSMGPKTGSEINFVSQLGSQKLSLYSSSKRSYCTRAHAVVKMKTITFSKNIGSRQYFSYIFKYLPFCIKKSCPILILDIVYCWEWNKAHLTFPEYMPGAKMPLRYIEHSQYLDKYDLFGFIRIIDRVSYQKYPLV